MIEGKYTTHEEYMEDSWKRRQRRDLIGFIWAVVGALFLEVGSFSFVYGFFAGEGGKWFFVAAGSSILIGIACILIAIYGYDEIGGTDGF